MLKAKSFRIVSHIANKKPSTIFKSDRLRSFGTRDSVLSARPAMEHFDWSILVIARRIFRVFWKSSASQNVRKKCSEDLPNFRSHRTAYYPREAITKTFYGL